MKVLNLKNKNKGITIIALVITIIILLILAGIAIVALTGENGLLSRAKQAKKNSLDAQMAENMALTGYEDSIEKMLGASRESNNSSILENVNIECTLNTNNLTVGIQTNNKDRTIGYHIFCLNKNNPNDKIIKVTEEDNITIKVQQATTYKVWVVAYDDENKEKISEVKEITTESYRKLYDVCNSGEIIRYDNTGTNQGWKILYKENNQVYILCDKTTEGFTQPGSSGNVSYFNTQSNFQKYCNQFAQYSRSINKSDVEKYLKRTVDINQYVTESILKTGFGYWLGTAYDTTSIYSINDDGMIDYWGRSNWYYGVRVLVCLNKDVYVKGYGTNEDPYILVNI